MTETVKEIIIHSFGFVGIVLLCFGFANKSVKGALKFKLLADIAWGIHYALLGAFGGTVLNVLGVIRESVFLVSKKSRKELLLVFVLVNFAAAYFRWEGIHSIIPAVLSALATYSFWQDNIVVTRTIGFINNILMFTYAAIVGSIMNMAAEVIVATSIIVTYIVKRNKQ